MKSLENLPGESVKELVTLPFENPTNILSQVKSNITTNPYIQEIKEEPIKPTETKNIISNINKGLSITCIELLNDLLDKPEDIAWPHYLVTVFTIKDRANYLAVLILFIIFFILLVN